MTAQDIEARYRDYASGLTPPEFKADMRAFLSQIVANPPHELGHTCAGLESMPAPDGRGWVWAYLGDAQGNRAHVAQAYRITEDGCLVSVSHSVRTGATESTVREAYGVYPWLDTP